jgi:hypothetical protein
MEILLDKIRELSQYQQLLKQLQTDGPASGQLPGLGCSARRVCLCLPRCIRIWIVLSCSSLIAPTTRFRCSMS